MDSTATLFLDFLVVSALLVVLALLLNPKLRAKIKIGPAEFRIDTSRPGWRREQSAKQSVFDQTKVHSGGSLPCQAWLVARVLGGADWRFCLDGRSQVYIGRHSSNEIVLLDHTADGRHAVIYWQDGRYRINNLSHRGTWVNNRPISWQNLGNGNKIRMGRTELVFRQNTPKPSENTYGRKS